MELRTRENAIIGICIILAIVAFFAMATYTQVGDELRIAIVLVIGVVLPTILTNYYSS